MCGLVVQNSVHRVKVFECLVDDIVCLHMWLQALGTVAYIMSHDMRTVCRGAFRLLCSIARLILRLSKSAVTSSQNVSRIMMPSLKMASGTCWRMHPFQRKLSRSFVVLHWTSDECGSLVPASDNGFACSSESHIVRVFACRHTLLGSLLVYQTVFKLPLVGHTSTYDTHCITFLSQVCMQ